MSFQKINNLLLFPGKLDDGIGNIFLGSGGDSIFFVSELKDSGAVLGDAIFFTSPGFLSGSINSYLIFGE